MKNLLYALFALLTPGFFSSCEKDEVDISGKGDYLIFGTFYGECGGERCVDIYKLENDRLLEDKKDMYPGSDFYPFDDFEVLSQEKFELVKDLIDFLPPSLVSEESGVIGQPDAGDWGGAFVEYKSGNIHKYWLLDQMETNMPEAFNVYVDKINEKEALIQQ
jgi:hypothetical protein